MAKKYRPTCCLFQSVVYVHAITLQCSVTVNSFGLIIVLDVLRTDYRQICAIGTVGRSLASSDRSRYHRRSRQTGGQTDRRPSVTQYGGTQRTPFPQTKSQHNILVCSAVANLSHHNIKIVLWRSVRGKGGRCVPRQRIEVVSVKSRDEVPIGGLGNEVWRPLFSPVQGTLASIHINP